MTTGRALPVDDVSPSLAPDESLLDRASSVLIGMDGDIARFRTRDPETGNCWLSFRTSWASDDCCRKLEHEFEMRDWLDTVWALKPVAFIRTGDGPVLLYRDTGATFLDAIAQDRPSITRFLRIAIAAARALAKLHERDLLHCDLRPMNLLMEDDGRVSLVSFGLLCEFDRADRGLAGVVSDRGVPYAPHEKTRQDGAYVDARSDLYSLGVTLFELLTGALPLNAQSVAEWLHAHVAVEPRAPSVLRNDAAGMLDALVLKLLAKDPLDRYQNASTLEADLARCLKEWTASGRIFQFELARADRLLRLARPTALFGRGAELGQLTDAYLRAARTGSAEVILLSGPAGSGKTALVNELARIAGRISASFGSGKPDQYQLATPYAPLVQALRSLVMGLLGGKRSDLEAKRAAIMELGGGQAQLVAQLAPELELVIGEHPKVANLAAGQVSYRVNRALLSVFQAFATEGAPLLLFLDDLQWADDATLEFVEMIVGWAPRNLVLVGAFRDQGQVRTKRFEKFLHDLAASSIAMAQVALSPITAADVAELIAAAIDEPRRRVAELACVVHEKTGGNPFYVNHLLRTLVEDRVVGYDVELQQWAWDISAIARRRQTDNIVDLLIARLGRLPSETREVLRLLACVGVRADDLLLTRVASVASDELQRRLEPAKKAGLITGVEGGWTFPHDRIQEAAYALTAETERPSQHASIAAAMFDLWQDRLQDAAFEIASQIELSVGALIAPMHVSRFAEGLITAADRAIAAAARTKAIAYLAAASRILGPDRWTMHYQRARRIAVLRAECLLATADLDAASVEIDGLFHRMQTDIDRAEAYRLRAAVQTVRSDFRGATATALSGLRLLGIDLPAQPSTEQLTLAYDAVKRGLNGRDISEIVDLPVMDDPRIEAAMALLTALEATFFFPSGGLMFLHFALMVELTLEFGVAPASVQGLSWFGVSVASTYDAPEEGLAYAEVALALVDRHGYERFRTATLVALDQVSVWTRPLSYAIGRAREAKAAGNLSAELRWLCYSCNHIISDLLVMGEELSKVHEEIEPLLEIACGAGYDDIVDLVSTQSEFVRSLRQGATTPVGSWEKTYSESAGASAFEKEPMSALFFWTYLWRGEAAFLLRDLPAATAALAKAGEFAWSAPAHINLSDYRLYAALTATQSVREPAGYMTAVRAVSEHRERFAKWAALNPQTFRNKLALLDAEMERLRGNDLSAMKLYEESASAAASEGFVHEQALAHELAGRHAELVGLLSVGRHHLRLAQSCYRRWGANGKVRQLEADYPFLVTELRQGGMALALGGHDDLDFLVVMQTAQALSEEIVFERLIETLMKSMIVHAGAQFGVLAIMKDDEPRIEATGRVIDGDVMVEIGGAAPTEDFVPLSILRTVVRSRKLVAFGDAKSQAPPRRGESRDFHPARSQLCLPLLKQGSLVGILYLDNNLAHDVFTPRKIAMLEVLAPQAANALEAARLYNELIEENRRRQETEAALRSARADLARASHLTVMGELAASIAHEINQPLSGIISSVGASLRWLQGEQPNVPEVLANLENIRDAGLRAAEIVRALRSLAKQEAAVLVSVAIDDLIRETLALTSVEIDKRQVRLNPRLDAAGVLVLADRIQLQQVVLNLIMNALDAMANIETPRELVVTSRAEDSSVIVSVQDTGEGVPEPMVRRIFDPFFTTKTTGMGMGLSICRSVMEAHGGTLEVAAASEGGGAFIFKLPIGPEP
jgi:predicted ATPase/signal transduction histidine kinase